MALATERCSDLAAVLYVPAPVTEPRRRVSRSAVMRRAARTRWAFCRQADEQ